MQDPIEEQKPTALRPEGEGEKEGKEEEVKKNPSGEVEFSEELFRSEWLELLSLIRTHLKTEGKVPRLKLTVPLVENEDRDSNKDLLGFTDIEVPERFLKLAGSGTAMARDFIVHRIAVNLYEAGQKSSEASVLPDRVVIYVLLHELAHSLSPPVMCNKDEKGRSKRHHWTHHDHNEDFYEKLERILRGAEILGILKFSHGFGGGGMSRKRAMRIDSFEVAGLKDFVKLGPAVPRWVAAHEKGFPLLTKIYGWKLE